MRFQIRRKELQRAPFFVCRQAITPYQKIFTALIEL